MKGKYFKWTPERCEQLKGMAALPVKCIAEVMGCSIAAVNSKKWEMGLHKGRPHDAKVAVLCATMSDQQAAKAIGISTWRVKASRLRQGIKRSNKFWTNEKKALLASLIARGETAGRIAPQVGASYWSVIHAARSMGCHLSVLEAERPARRRPTAPLVQKVNRQAVQSARIDRMLLLAAGRKPSTWSQPQA